MENNEEMRSQNGIKESGVKSGNPVGSQWQNAASCDLLDFQISSSTNGGDAGGFTGVGTSENQTVAVLQVNQTPVPDTLKDHASDEDFAQWGFDDAFFEQFQNEVEDNTKTVGHNNTEADENRQHTSPALPAVNTSGQIYQNPLVSSPSQTTAPPVLLSLNTFSATIVENIIFKVEVSGNECLLTKIGSINRTEFTVEDKAQSWLNTQHLVKLGEDKILLRLSQEISAIKGNISKNKSADKSADLNKRIIKKVTKIVLDNLLGDNDVLAGSSSGRSTKTSGENSSTQTYDKSKKFLAAAICSWIISQGESLTMTMQHLKAYVEDVAGKYSTGLEDHWKFFDKYVSSYTYNRRKNLSEKYKESGTRKKQSKSKKDGASTSKKSRVSSEQDR